MPARIRLQRAGRKKRAFFRIVVADSRANRDGRYIERLGHYDPIPDPAELVVNNERALYWLQQGAQPTDTARSLLKQTGAWQLFKQPWQLETRLEEASGDADQSEE